MRWFGHIERMENEEFVKVYLSSVEGTNRRERPLEGQEDRVKEYGSEGKWVGVGKEGVYGLGEVEVRLPWPLSWEILLEGGRH